MSEKQLYNLNIDSQFKNSIPPLSNTEFIQLEENIKKGGCREPLCVWNNTIIDGHNRYQICHKLKIPFYIQEVDYLQSREEIIDWICSNQIGRRNISDETRKYLIGKRYEMEKIINKNNPLGNNQYTKKQINSEIESKSHKTAEKLGREYNLSRMTIQRYGKFASDIDNLSKKSPELINDFFKGNFKITQSDLSNLSKMHSKTISDVKNKLSEPNNMKLKEVKKIFSAQRKPKITIKDMPKYDPDAEVSSLTLTIPSWVSSINRTLSAAKLDVISNVAKTHLLKELAELKYTIETLQLAIEEV